MNRFRRGAAALLLLLASSAWTVLLSQTDGPLRASQNANYFADRQGHAVILNGSQTWNTFQDWGTDGVPRALEFDAFVQFLGAHGHNFTLLWTTELPKFCGLPVTAQSPPDFTVSPFPWQRGGDRRFDLGRFDNAFFERLRSRVQALDRAQIYAGVYLFSGEFLNVFRCAGDGYPLTGGNNINGIDDGYTGGKKGTGSITMTAPNAITRVQDAYVEKVVDTLNDLPNVLWIVSEEAPADSTWWNDHQIAHLRAYEAKKPRQHPIGYAALIGAPDTVLYNSDADWAAPQARISPVRSCGSGKPACKVNVNDSDHSYWEMWKETPQKNRNYAWENFANGNQVLFMDPYLVYYPREKRNLCVVPQNGICAAPDARWDNFRDNLGYILRYARKLDLARVLPQPALSSTGFCLAAGAQYLVYAPAGGAFTVDLSPVAAGKRLAVEWFDPASGAATPAKPVAGGSKAEKFTPPFAGDAVLYLSEGTK